VLDKTHKMIRIKWVRSGIGFTYRQKTIVRSLGLKRLNQVVLRVDTPQNRGIVAAVPHLLEIIPGTPAPAWTSIPECTVHPREEAPVSAEAPSQEVDVSTVASEPTATEPAAETVESSGAGKPKKVKATKEVSGVAESKSEKKPAAKKGSKAAKATKE
jgi:large subunit ribosomal protein L30